jgi:hypothetical protein
MKAYRLPDRMKKMPLIHHLGRTVLYLHVPKTGGGTIEAWLRSVAPLRFHSVGVPAALRCTPQHLRMSDFRDLFGDEYFDHVFMTVRNPYARVASEYRMHAALSGQGFWKAWPTFSHWLETHLHLAAAEPFALDNHLRPQWHFLGSGVEVLRFESGLPAILARMAEVIGAPPPAAPEHVHKTTGAGVAVAFDRIDRLRIQEFYARDFEIFGYDPNDPGETVDR